MKKFTALFLSSVVALVSAQYPSIPLQFTSQVTINVQSLFPMPEVSGFMSYDYAAQTQRIDSKDPNFGSITTTLDRYDLGNSYTFVQGQSQCDCQPVQGKMPNYQILPGAAYKGQQTVNGVNADTWEYGLIPGANITVYTSGNNLVESQMTVNNMGMEMITTMDFNTFTPGPIPSSTFAVPSFCSGACPTPAPPATPAPNACPGNPPQGCECPSMLSFCSGVNYPVTSTFGADDVDTMAASMINSFSALQPGPTQQCVAQTKAFICATLFPLCTGSIVPVLPCPSLCPTSCGDVSSSNNTCAAALPSNICTNYQD
ncbi:hypothetical protein DICPUDRAFT_76853 [Dictyostelium purpureum]|uniref:FZ domain-containing protein n=1 Tax=Dictyostelium purpureum TaxID=5786 RepID=F0ZEU3_DICPU|nr:uncharacterized protein DICPUDRAFT_76853 [Dictyostelium purpureum]EGC37554.1 hypothetical protein DICPUDRAFT_76853 [Dictyostelium purpureum]|eukprot:XP_003285945.1 hypothetical protein DICPUDRAFT_76853 [Dictyostelium purpureum]